jgi:alpha-tubulin suppressor-like RCC1 family protein
LDDEGQLGLDLLTAVTTPTRVGSASDWIQIETSALHACGLRGLGDVYCWGRVQEGQLAVPFDPSPQTTPIAIESGYQALEITVGRFTTCGIHGSGQRYCTGENDEGQLGNGTTTRSYTFVPVQGF